MVNNSQYWKPLRLLEDASDRFISATWVSCSTIPIICIPLSRLHIPFPLLIDYHSRLQKVCNLEAVLLEAEYLYCN
ncbi:hypothetical protein I7I53_10930 [Histoplasma capsulatum var. duboisii H88]|uniref:Uncharacterized protein n=1 Tax=Ajellomyces capsulatus (strain H88) TaxID=544711 RepID=A0A8A1L9K3_AJEC8|nr:hypothetical protein I7I53_10930 [Histoplasma capsulatum var. duboisii H88]